MNISTITARTAVAVATLALLTGCAQNTTTSPTPAPTGTDLVATLGDTYQRVQDADQDVTESATLAVTYPSAKDRQDKATQGCEVLTDTYNEHAAAADEDLLAAAGLPVSLPGEDPRVDCKP